MASEPAAAEEGCALRWQSAAELPVTTARSIPKGGYPMAKDPVCGMQVDEQPAGSQGLTSEEQGQTYSCCSPTGKQQFDQNPRRYTRQQTGQC